VSRIYRIMSQQNSSPDNTSPKSSLSVQSNLGRAVYPGRIMKVNTSNDESSSSNLRHKPFTTQTSLNSSSEIRSRKRIFPQRRASADSRVDEHLELVDVNTSPRSSHGHRFISASLSQPTWCDKCGDFIWGVYKQCLICTSKTMLVFNCLLPFKAVLNACV